MRLNSKSDYKAFAEAVENVEDGRCVLVHCSAGSSRSPSVSAAEITQLSGINLNETFNQIIEQRPETDPHDALVRQTGKITNQNPD